MIAILVFVIVYMIMALIWLSILITEEVKKRWAWPLALIWPLVLLFATVVLGIVVTADLYADYKKAKW